LLFGFGATNKKKFFPKRGGIGNWGKTDLKFRGGETPPGGAKGFPGAFFGLGKLHQIFPIIFNPGYFALKGPNKIWGGLFFDKIFGNI